MWILEEIELSTPSVKVAGLNLYLLCQSHLAMHACDSHLAMHACDP